MIRYGKEGYGKPSTVERYKKEESKTIKISHTQILKDGATLLWLESYGLTSWAIKILPGEKINLE